VTHDTALLLIDVINHLEFEGNEGLTSGTLHRVSQSRSTESGHTCHLCKSDFRHVIEYVEDTSRTGLSLLFVGRKNPGRLTASTRRRLYGFFYFQPSIIHSF
jgi:hypothetical protein